MNMTEGEIITSYRQAKSPRKQIKIIAELNQTDQDTIKGILIKHGVMKAPEKKEIVKKGLVSKQDMDEMIKKPKKEGITKEQVEEIKDIIKHEGKEECKCECRTIIPDTIRMVLEQDIISINNYIHELEARRDEIEKYLGWDKIEESLNERAASLE